MLHFILFQLDYCFCFNYCCSAGVHVFVKLNYPIVFLFYCLFLLVVAIAFRVMRFNCINQLTISVSVNHLIKSPVLFKKVLIKIAPSVLWKFTPMFCFFSCSMFCLVFFCFMHVQSYSFSLFIVEVFCFDVCVLFYLNRFTRPRNESGACTNLVFPLIFIFWKSPSGNVR